MRALGQKYMGIRPEKHTEEMFKAAAEDMTIEGGHAIPVNVSKSLCVISSKFIY
jgi:saccharopepsin